jgi:glutamine synthetase
MISRIDYIWLDGEGEIRNKTRYMQLPESPTISDIPDWTFDGSSTGQAITSHSDLILKPVRMFAHKTQTEQTEQTKQTERINTMIVVCGVYMPDGSPHSTNYRDWSMKQMDAAADQEPWFGIEQEYIITYISNDRNIIMPYGWKTPTAPYSGTIIGGNQYGVSQGPFYCGIGGTRAFGRRIVEEHTTSCFEFGVLLCGTNAEVMASQWEYQIGPLPGDLIGDHLIVSRYLLQQVAEKYGADISFHPKPVHGWNGSGGHTNFSTKAMRESIDAIYAGCEKLAMKHEEHMPLYGNHNEMRLCGEYETSNPAAFTWGVGDRACSVRIPQHVFDAKKGYLEDRRPAANLDPYLVCGKIVETICL